MLGRRSTLRSVLRWLLQWISLELVDVGLSLQLGARVLLACHMPSHHCKYTKGADYYWAGQNAWISVGPLTANLGMGQCRRMDSQSRKEEEEGGERGQGQ